MTSIIKNQLVKHLSKFTKNLQPEQISLDVLKGKSKLQFVEINEHVLTEILELPHWLKIRRAFCSGVSINVPWTKLKTCPIELFIDEINVEVELTDEKSQSEPTSPTKKILNENGSYGFINKIVENMSVYINTVEINFNSDVFGGSFMLQRLSVESRSPGWAPVKDLRQTRISCPISNFSLIFKQISWHLLRIEASAKSSKDEKRSKINAPLRLITSGGKMRVALKKNITDGTVVHARIQTILEDILWVATLPQLRSAISFASYVVNLVKRSSQSSELASTSTNLDFCETMSNDISDPGTIASPYKVFYFNQTSYHLHVKQIDLHLCDDAHLASGYPPQWDIESGAMQVTLIQLLIDVYPKTKVTSDRSTWMKYPNPTAIADWLKKNLSDQLDGIARNSKDETMKTRLKQLWPQMIGFFVVLRIYDLTIQCVSDLNTKKDALKNLVESERHLHSLPNDQQVVHCEFSSFYHPHSNCLQVPKPVIYCNIGPFTFNHNERTARWVFYVIHTLQAAFETEKPHSNVQSNVQLPVIKLNFIMIRIVLLATTLNNDFRFPRRFVVSMSSLCVSTSLEDFSQCDDYSQLIKLLHKTIEEIGQQKQEVESIFMKTSPMWIETDNGLRTKGVPLLNDAIIIGTILFANQSSIASIESLKDVSLAVDHFQLIELLRFNESLNEFMNVMKNDYNHYQIEEYRSNAELKFFVEIPLFRLYMILPTGDIPSPYSQYIPETDGFKFQDQMTENSLTKEEHNSNAMQTDYAIRIKSALEHFPECPTAYYENDLAQSFDETASITMSIDDDATNDYNEMLNNESDDILGIPDVAQEAVVIDEIAKNDNIYQCIMTETINLLVLNLEKIYCNGVFADKELRLNGNVEKLDISENLSVQRNLIQKMLQSFQLGPHENLQENVSTFALRSFSNNDTISLTVNVQNVNIHIDDQIVTHLSAFAKDDIITKNNLRVSLNIHNSSIIIVDRKKLKPLRIRIKNIVIEQDED